RHSCEKRFSWNFNTRAPANITSVSIAGSELVLLSGIDRTGTAITKGLSNLSFPPRVKVSNIPRTTIVPRRDQGRESLDPLNASALSPGQQFFLECRLSLPTVAVSHIKLAHPGDTQFNQTALLRRSPE